MNIHIFYRHYNDKNFSNPSRPEWFSYKNCFYNLLNSITSERKIKSNVTFNLVMDGDVGDNWIKSTGIPFLQVNGGGDWESFQQLLKIVKDRQDIKSNDLIYFIENDYLHVNGWVEKVIELFTTYEGLDYVSLYDHKDKYFYSMYDDLVSKILITDSHHWRSTPSTCGSFIISKKIFDEDFDILSTMQGDHNKFLWLNKHKGRSVITPIPGLSTHCMKGLMSPTIDWSKINN
jgi:hypothetical protein